MTKIKSIGKIVAVSMMSAIISISFNGCGFFKSTGNQALASLGNVAEKGISNAISSESKSSSSKAKVANNENDKGKCSSNEIKTDTSIEKGECKGGKRNGVWKYYDNYGYIQKEITFQNGEMTLEKAYDKDENLSDMTRYNKGEIFKRGYSYKKLSSFTHSNAYFNRYYYIGNLNEKIAELKKQAQKVAKQRAESKVKKPTMQEVKNSKNAMETYRAKLQAQEEQELKSLSPSIDFNTSSDEQIIAFINSNNLKPSKETISNGNLKIIVEGIATFYIGASEVGYLQWGSCSESYHSSYKEKYNCRTFATQFKELIDKSAFKDDIYNALPKPKNM